MDSTYFHMKVQLPQWHPVFILGWPTLVPNILQLLYSYGIYITLCIQDQPGMEGGWSERGGFCFDLRAAGFIWWCWYIANTVILSSGTQTPIGQFCSQSVHDNPPLSLKDIPGVHTDTIVYKDVYVYMHWLVHRSMFGTHWVWLLL